MTGWFSADPPRRRRALFPFETAPGSATGRGRLPPQAGTLDRDAPVPCILGTGCRTRMWKQGFFAPRTEARRPAIPTITPPRGSPEPCLGDVAQRDGNPPSHNVFPDPTLPPSYNHTRHPHPPFTRRSFRQSPPPSQRATSREQNPFPFPLSPARALPILSLPWQGWSKRGEVAP